MQPDDGMGLDIDTVHSRILWTWAVWNSLLRAQIDLGSGSQHTAQTDPENSP